MCDYRMFDWIIPNWVINMSHSIHHHPFSNLQIPFYFLFTHLFTYLVSDEDPNEDKKMDSPFHISSIIISHKCCLCITVNKTINKNLRGDSTALQ